MTLTNSMAQFSEAYAIALASAAGCSVSRNSIDDDSVDLTLVSSIAAGQWSRPKLDVPLKATSQDILKADHLAYPLKIKNFRDLQPLQLHTPKILVVMILPFDPNWWLRHHEHHTSMYRCGYWRSLRGEPDTSNETSVTVELPRANIFDKVALQGMMNRIAQG